MMELTEEIRAVIDKTTAAMKLGEGEYIAPADGLVHCRKCGAPRQTVIRSPFGGYIAPRCVCPCQQEKERRRREAEERRQRMERIRRRKAQGLQDRYLYGYTFAHDNGENPVMAKAHAYVNHWPQAFKKNIGLLLFGDVGTGKSFLAGCIAKNTHRWGIKSVMPKETYFPVFCYTTEPTNR